jgi:hypothetical protein
VGPGAASPDGGLVSVDGGADGGNDDGGSGNSEVPFSPQGRGCACDSVGGGVGDVAPGALVGLAIVLAARRRRVCARAPAGRH